MGSIPAPGSITSVATIPTPPTEGSSMTSAAPSFIESLLGPLAIPKPATPTRASLLLSPALSPIPANIVEKIKSGEYVDMKEMLGDNIALHQRMEEVHRRGSSST